jgi:hypothetical protein
MLVRLLYSSEAAEPVTGALLDDILSASRRHNPELGVTGLLVISGSSFIQVLEGGRDEVCDLYNAIVRDGRHRKVRLLSFDEITERQFASWTMGHVHASKLNPGLLLKYFSRARLEPNEASGKATMALLLELVETASIVGRAEN